VNQFTSFLVSHTPQSEKVVMEVTHPSWSDLLYLQEPFFHRAKTGCSGRVETLPDGCLFLKWDRWKPEILDSTRRILSLDQYCHRKKSGVLDLPRTWSAKGRGVAKVCIVTFSRERLNHVSSLVAFMKAQSEECFVHVIHAIGYTGQQYQFLQQMVGDDERFILRETVVMSQKEHLVHVLADARRFETRHYLKIDDDDIYAPGFLKTILEEAGDNDFTAGTSLFIHSTHDNQSRLALHHPNFGNNMCFSTRAVDCLLTSPDKPTCRFEDSFAHHTLRDGGFKVRTFGLGFPEILYLRHGKNVS
jgi:hypothetical protein